MILLEPLGQDRACLLREATATLSRALKGSQIQHRRTPNLFVWVLPCPFKAKPGFPQTGSPKRLSDPLRPPRLLVIHHIPNPITGQDDEGVLASHLRGRPLGLLLASLVGWWGERVGMIMLTADLSRTVLFMEGGFPSNPH